jgi:GAF domain-containing protein
MATLPEDVSDDLRLVIDELESAIADMESRLESTRAERDEAKARQVELTIENANLFNETQQARDRQAASAEILRAIASASGDAEQALQLIAETTARLFGAPSVSIQLVENGKWGQAYRFGDSAQRIRSAVPLANIQIGGQNMPGAVVGQNLQFHIPDLDHLDASFADWPGLPHARAAGTRTMCGTPLRREGNAIGALIIYRDRLAPFTDEELALQQSFADQAVIAIENARLFNETGEALERQTVTADILKVIASSPSDTTPVFQAIATSASRLLGGFSAAVFRFLDGTVHLAAFTPVSPAADAALKADFPKPVDEFEGFRLAQQGKPFPITDTEEIPHPLELREIARLHGFRSMLFVPLINGSVLIGIISVTRREPGAFSPNHIQLLQTFADQAVIAIQNARLFNETQEALERQTATADILRVIASSPSDVQPVFEAIAGSANRLLGGFSTAVFRFVDGVTHLAAFTSTNPTADEVLKSHFPRPLAGFEAFQLAQEGKPVPIADTEADQDERIREIGRTRGFRSMLFVPLMSGGATIGVISVTRVTTGSFADHHVTLLQTFADQAVIAIENVRLFNETQEALERQTATADILKVIASSPDDVQPVFDAIATSSKQLIGAFSATVFRFVDGIVNLVAYTPIDPAADEVLKASFPRPAAGLPFFELAKGGEVVQEADSENNTDAGLRAVARARGFRSSLFSPLMNKQTPIGLIVVTRKEPGTFAAHHVQLVQTFADQAVIAIENARLFNETKEALERQTATGEILKVIASSPTDVQPVFDAIAASANRLIGGFSSTVMLFVRDALQLVAFTPTTPTADEMLQASFPRPLAEFPPFELVRDGETVQFPDTESEDVPPLNRALARSRGYRGMLFTPLMSKGAAIGILSVTRKEPGAFAVHHVQLLRTFADQAVIAIENVRLFDEVQAKTADLSEALQQQTATADVLKVISRSAFDLDTVMNTLTRSASELCAADMSGLFLREGDFLVARGVSNIDAKLADMVRTTPVSIDDQTYMGRTLLTGEIANLADVESDPLSTRFLAFQKAFGYRSLMVVPLMREGRGVGVFALCSNRPGAFSQRQIELVQTFADQAVIAIENVRLFDEVQARTRDLTEALTYQTGSSNILKVIASSPTDVEPVLKAIVESSCELCGAYDALVRLKDGDSLAFGAHHGPLPVSLERVPVTENSTGGLAVIERKPIHVHDLLSPEGDRFPHAQELARMHGGARTMLSVPLLRENESIGAIVLRRTEVQPFSEKQIGLLQTFADQAVIAIGNVRLFEEVQARTRDLTEALTYQTGSSNILKVIASSPTDVGPVLKAIVESACELCGAYDALVRLKDGDGLAFGAHHGPLPVSLASVPITENSTGGLAVIERKPVHVHDLLSPEGDRFPHAQELARMHGERTILSVPLLRENESVGALIIRRREVDPFTDKQIILLQTFADQAVIAIGNVRLFDEVQAKTRDLTEALTYQTGSSNILRVIASSPTDVGPVLKAIVESACELCEADDALATLRDGDDLLFMAQHGSIPVMWQRMPINRQWPSGRAVVDRKPVHVHDLLADEGEPFPDGQEMARRSNVRTVLSVPLLRENQSIGAIVLRRCEVQPFSEKQISLLQTFADQAVIAIGNVRLFDEVQARTRDLTESLQQQTATADVLRVISRSAFDLQPVLDVIVETSRELCGCDASTIFLLRDGRFHVTAVSGALPAHLEFLRSNPAPVDQPGSILARMYREKRTLNYANVADDPELSQGMTGLGGPRALLTVPLMRDDEVIGGITLRQSHLKPFTDRQIEAIETFADQAVIAISNVGLFEQVQQRTKELSQSLDELRTAQDRLVQTEKLASLGQLTAGIAHEIKNPLNFVNNFSALSAELTVELNDLLKSAVLTDAIRVEVDELTGMLKDNLEKVVQHGKRADSIVKNMLLHSREGSGEHRPADINALLDESLNLAYHGARAEKREFNVTLRRDFDATAGDIEVFPQEITRVFLNLISNGFYAVTKRRAENGNSGFEPLLVATTRNLGETVEIRIRDNGTGIPEEVREKMFNPFFTTKPAGEGTGLGLSMSHDIIVKQHGGRIDVATEPGQFTEFTILLPRKSNQTNNQSNKNGGQS